MINEKIKVKARILTDVEMILDADIEDTKRENKRKILEQLAKDGYVNNELVWIETERFEPDEEIDIELIEPIEFYYGIPNTPNAKKWSKP